MISSVTTSTITAIALEGGVSTALSFVAVLAFLSLLITREMVGPSAGRLQVLARGLQIGIIPLGLAFVMIAAYNLVQLLA
jgi:hypothetical protein